MKLYIAKWPNGTATILTASSKKDLYSKLDEEGDPACADIQQVNFLNGDIHITANFDTNRDGVILNEGVPNIQIGFGDYSTGEEIKTRKVSFA